LDPQEFSPLYLLSPDLGFFSIVDGGEVTGNEKGKHKIKGEKGLKSSRIAGDQQCSMER
jgi:hypothetical protein